MVSIHCHRLARDTTHNPMTSNNYFQYYNGVVFIPRDVTHVRVRPDVKKIHDGAFAFVHS